ncbi:MAG TPA: hypothetical protein VLG92_04320 [Candidatus Saccharimonadia bacterium]|nr:hypothetical protein [Candidatus Saccharimonadia bacterium]
MYSGTLLRPSRQFDTWFGAHQKIDRVARRHLARLLPRSRSFPTQKNIIRFEGIDGPDGIKLKTPAQGELWHFIDPDNKADRQLLKVLEYNYQELVAALKGGNQTRAAFEAAWLAHGIVDGLTPAHHYPYEDELIRLRGEGIETRVTPKDKLLIPGSTLPERVSKNWQVWGDKGLITTHFAFEWGVAAMIAPLRFKGAVPTESELENAMANGLSETFLSYAKAIAALKMYDQFYKSGWTPKLAKQMRRELLPSIINMVTIAWYLAAREAYGNA